MKHYLKAKIISHPLATFILLNFILLGGIYSWVTPPFEAGDESRHYAVVKYMADTGRLPVQQASEAQIHWSHEGNQPPLYYALAALLTAWIDTGDWEDVFWYNPHTTIGDPLRPDNKNITIQPLSASDRSDHRLAVHLIRLLSVAMGAITILAAYRIALYLFRGNRWLAAGAMAITAFNPMFIFISAAVNNDNAVIMFVTLALWLMIRLVVHQPNLSISAQAAWLGLLIGLGALSKLYAFGLLPVAGSIFLWLAYQQSDKTLKTRLFWRRAIGWNLILILIVTVVAGWFYLRNAILYDGDIFALQMMRDTAGQRDELPSLATIWAEFEGFRIAYWALFGGVNILADGWIYKVLDGISLVAILGVLIFLGRIFRSRSSKDFVSPPALIILSGWFLVMMAGFIVWNLTQPAGQGRLLYPAIAAISALGMLGLSWWLPPTGQKIMVGFCGLGLLIFAWIAPFRYIAPAYARPPLLTEAELPESIQPVNFIYEDKIRLIGYQLHVDTVQPAQNLPLTLYWQLLQPVDMDYSIFVHLLGRQHQVIGQVDTYPGDGKWPTTLLSPGDIVADHYAVPISSQAEFEHAPTRLTILAGIYDRDEPGRPGKSVTNQQGQPIEPVIATAKLIPWQWPEPNRSPRPINFFDKVTLLSHQLSEDQKMITFNWEVQQPLAVDYTVFIQAWDTESNEYVFGFDGPPVQGDYPTTLWEPGEIIVDTHSLALAQLPPGQYRLLAGLYHRESGDRLPAFGPDGPLPDYAVEVGTIQIPQPQE